MLIFGFGPGKAKDLGPVVRTVCPSCHNDVLLHHVQSKKSFRLYFVPVLPYGTDEFLLCPVCGRGVEISKEQLAAVDAMKALTAQYEQGQVADSVYAEHVTSFWRQLGLTATGPSSPPPATTEAGPADPFHAGDDRSWVAQLEDLERLHAEGVLTDEQFETAKERLIQK